MTPHKNTFLSKYGRRVLALAAGLLIVTGGFWSATHRAAPSTRSLDGIAEEMRKDPLQWGKTEKDASTLVQDMRDNRLAAVGVTANAMLVSTRTGEKYFVTDRSATFSSSLLLSQMRDGKAGHIPGGLAAGQRHWRRGPQRLAHRTRYRVHHSRTFVAGHHPGSAFLLHAT